MVTSSFSANKFSFLKGIPKNQVMILLGEKIIEKEEVESLFNEFDYENKELLKDALHRKGVQSICLLENECLDNWEDSLKIIQGKIEFNQSHFVLLVPYAEWEGPRQKTLVNSFLASVDFFVDCLDSKNKVGVCFNLSEKAISGDSQVEQILVNQPGHPNPFIAPKKTAKSIRTEMVIPHKGELSLLKNALFSIKKQSESIDEVTVCFDEFITDQHYQIVEDHSNFRFFANHPTGVGPYPPRDVLARMTEKEVIFFHDSDDVSTVDRVAAQSSALSNNNIDAVGSHEIRLNKLSLQVEAFRYPLKVNEVLKKRALSSIFFPTTAIKKSAYLKAGGLSTIRRHSSDTQFWWRAHFYMDLINIDEFLYIRVKREGSLTTAVDTALGSPVRERIGNRWRRDFMKVRDHIIPLVESTLVDEYRDEDFKLIPLKEENRQLIYDWQIITEQLHQKATLSVREKPKFPSQADILKDRILHKKGSFSDADYPEVMELKESASWKIGWAITRAIMFLVGWIPFVKNKIK